MDDSMVQIAFRGTEGYKIRLKRYALDHGMSSVQQLIDTALGYYLARADDAPKPVADDPLSDAERAVLEGIREYVRRNRNRPELPYLASLFNVSLDQMIGLLHKKH